MNDIKSVLAKLALNEEEAMIFFKHFASRFINEECYINIEVSSSNEIEDGKEYANISIATALMVEETPLLNAEDSCTILLGEAITLPLTIPTKG